jgi:PPK2 family polyphosphate:nucleotide phosphotransferase
MLPAQIIARLRVEDGGDFRLADRDPKDMCGLDIGKNEAEELLATATKRLSELQERLYAEGRWAVLAILQGADTSGKDGVIKSVFSGVNPQGCEVHSFKQPSALELDHDFLWRTTVALPTRGRVGIFNRSYYEETVVVRVHPELLEKQNLPKTLVTAKIWSERYEDIKNFELHLARSGVVPLKFYLHISKEEQRERLLARIADPEKRWKFALHDVEERKLWDKFVQAYDDTIAHTATAHAPWYIIPADRKWFARLAVATILVERMTALDLQFPKLDESALAELKTAEADLLGEAKAPSR